MNEYKKWLKRSEVQSVCKVLAVCTLLLILGLFAAYSNTRANGFGDFSPFSYYLNKIKNFIEYAVQLVEKYTYRFMH